VPFLPPNQQRQSAYTPLPKWSREHIVLASRAISIVEISLRCIGLRPKLAAAAAAAAASAITANSMAAAASATGAVKLG